VSRPNNVLTALEVSKLFAMSEREVISLTKAGVFRVVDGCEPDQNFYNRAEIFKQRFGEGGGLPFDYGNPILAIPHRKFLIYIIAVFGNNIEDVNNYLSVSELWPISVDEFKVISELMLSVSPSDEFTQLFNKCKHSDSEEYMNWVNDLGVSGMVNGRFSLPVELLRNKNARLLVETAGASGIPISTISGIVKSTFGISLSDDNISTWLEYFYQVSDIPQVDFYQLVESKYNKEGQEAKLLRIGTQFQSPISISRIQKYYIINYDHAWRELWSIIAGMSFEQMVESVKGGKAFNAKMWSDVIEKAMSHGEQKSNVTAVMPLSGSDNDMADDVTIHDIDYKAPDSGPGKN